MKKQIGFVCFGEVNTPIERLKMKHDEALGVLQAQGYEILDAGLVIDDPAYETADAAWKKLVGYDMSCLVICAAGWVPTHAVIRITDHYRNVPMLLWGARVKPGTNLGTGDTFADISATILEYFGVDRGKTAGTSFLRKALR